MKLALRIIATLFTLAWLAVVLLQLKGLWQTPALGRSLASLMPMFGHPFDEALWQQHRYAALVVGVAASLLGLCGGLMLVRLELAGLLMMGLALASWLLYLLLLRWLHAARYGYERVAIGSDLQLLGILVLFVLFYLLVVRMSWQRGVVQTVV